MTLSIATNDLEDSKLPWEEEVKKAPVLRRGKKNLYIILP
jgi:hypothetical protein